MSDYTNKGDERKHCPNCGAVLPASAAVCPKCGYELSGIEANLSSVVLATLLAGLEYDEDKCQAIETFPIPNSKADLLEFITSLKPRIQNVENPLADAYLVKYQELLEKIKVSFPNDAQLKPFVDEFGTLHASIKEAKKKMGRKYWVEDNKKMLIAAIVLVVALVAGGIVLITSRDTAANNAERCVAAVTNAVDNNKLKAARDYVVGYKNDKEEVIEGYVTLLSKYLDEGMWEEAKSLVEYYGQGAYTAPLNRGLYNYLLSVGEYEQAEAYINVEAAPTDKEYYEYMEECVKLMCSAGLTTPAEEFIAKKSLHFVSNRSGNYTKARVQERLRQIVQAYK